MTKYRWAISMARSRNLSPSSNVQNRDHNRKSSNNTTSIRTAAGTSQGCGNDDWSEVDVAILSCTIQWLLGNTATPLQNILALQSAKDLLKTGKVWFNRSFTISNHCSCLLVLFPSWLSFDTCSQGVWRSLAWLKPLAPELKCCFAVFVQSYKVTR
jgi:hypothetical protein